MASWVYEQGRAAGEAIGKAESLLLVLEKRGVSVPNEARERILACTDVTQLNAWIDRSLLVARVEELFDDH